ncbi:conserved hypothetical protein, partial [delta proteobacterium NaphS2]
MPREHIAGQLSQILESMLLFETIKTRTAVCRC